MPSKLDTSSADGCIITMTRDFGSAPKCFKPIATRLAELIRSAYESFCSLKMSAGLSGYLSAFCSICLITGIISDWGAIGVDIDLTLIALRFSVQSTDEFSTLTSSIGSAENAQFTQVK